jgi:murein DD-endopeptidase MepM/ murein hydrolase activator NlpD
MQTKRLGAIIIAFFILSSIPATGMVLRAANTASLSDEIENVRKERENLLLEQQKLQAELDKVTQEGRSLGTAVKSLDTTKKKLASDIKVTQSKIASSDLNIKLLENNVHAAERQMTAHERAIQSSIQALAKYDSRSLLVDLVAYADFSDLWSDRSRLAELSTRLEDEIEDLRATKAKLSEEKVKKEKVKEQALTLANELTGQKAAVEESQKAKERLLAETKNKEALYQQLIAENERREKQFEEDLFRLESQLKITLDPSLIPAPRKGLLSWPLDKITVTTTFGRVSGAALRIYASGSHNGTDFRASQGTRVLSMGNGVVTGTGNTDEQKGCGSYGRWVLIRYHNGLTSVYGHMSSVIVREGQEVKSGEAVGYSGGTPGVFGSGYSTGPHLHVGVFASQGVSVRQFTESRGCQQVVVPIADVKAYLDPMSYLPSL